MSHVGILDSCTSHSSACYLLSKMASSLFPKDKVASLYRGKKGSREEVPVGSLDGEGKVLGLYFSAHWCPPCRGFTPKLAEWYTKLTTGPLKDKFEIVFVSSDKDEDSFDSYFDEMPWLALPYSAREHKASLSQKYKVDGIPTLVFVNAANGELITKDGRAVVMEDTNGENFPWKPQTFEQIISSCKFVNKEGKEIAWGDCKNGTVGVYFSAHWCGPCRSFTPTLVETYNKIKADGKNFEIIFASSDRSEEDFKSYLSAMPWYALPFGDKAKNALSKKYEVSGIPTLIILEGETGKVITENGRAAVSMDPDGKEFPWHKKPIEVLNGYNAGDLNNSAHVMWFAEDQKDIDHGKKILTPIAEDYFKDDNEDVCFKYTNKADDEDDIAESLAKFMNLSVKRPLLAIFDIPSQKKVELGSEITEESVRDALKKFKDGSLDTKGIKD